MLQEELTADLRHLATELDELGKEGTYHHAPFAATEDSRPPDLPDFQIKSPLGHGGMGTVYLARQVSLGREVAVKVIETKAGTRVRGHAGRVALPDEARIVAQLHHPNIVQVYSAGREGDRAWFAMELVNGESADKHAFASAEDVARIGASVAEALAYAHRCGILHRDVKPANVFIGADGQVKLGDFGLACLASSNMADGSGTRRYMAPELLLGAEATEKSDLFSLGVTLRELAERVKDASPDFAAICAKAANPDPTGRYESVDAMLADLRRFLAQEPVSANPPSPWRRFRLFGQRNPLAAAGAVAVAVCLLAFVQALAIGYVRTSRALDAVHREAAMTAQSLATILTDFDRSEGDPREQELKRALEVAESLAARFPDDETIKESVEAIRKARRRRAVRPVRPGAGPGAGRIPDGRPNRQKSPRTDTRSPALPKSDSN